MNVFNILFLLSDVIEVKDYFEKIFTLETVKCIFIQFKSNGFDIIHDTIIYFLKQVLVKISKYYEKNQLNLNNIDESLKIIKNNDYANIGLIIVNNFELVLYKIKIIEKITNKVINNIFSNFQTILFIVNNINNDNIDIFFRLFKANKLTDTLFNAFYYMHEKKVFNEMLIEENITELSSITNKFLLFSTLYQLINFIEAFNGKCANCIVNI